MTVKEFIGKHLDATLNLMIPSGYVTVTPAIVVDLLQGKSVDVHPGANECWAKMSAEELLAQEVVQCKEHPDIPNCFYLLSGYVQEHGNETMKFLGMMQAKCWRGEHPFAWDDVSFEQEIIADDNKLNFYVPIFFDAYGIFGEAVGKLEPDDSYNVYANYDLDEGDISEYLEIVVKYGDSHDGIAYYQLSPEEQEMFLQKMNDYCQAQTGQNLAEWTQKYAQENSITEQSM